MFSFIVILVLLFVYVLARVVIHGRHRPTEDVQRLPGPSSAIASWIWGHELLTFQHQATQMYSIWARSFGGLYKIKAALFHPDILIATDHAAVQHIFAHSDLYVKSPAFRPPVANLLGKGLVWAEGEDWHKQRRILAPAFSQESVKGMTSAIYECAERLESRLTNAALSNSHTSRGVEVNIVDFISACTLDIIGLVALSHSFSAQSSSASELHSDAAQIRDSWSNHVNTGLTSSAFFAPIVVRTIPWVTKAPLPLMRAQGIVKGIVSRLGRKIVEREQGAISRQEERHYEQRKPRGKDILTNLLRARQSEVGKDGSWEGLNDQQILDNISTFTMVGHETTAGCLNFTLWELSRQPEVQDRLRAEILSHGRDLSYEEIQKLEFLDAVVKEGLRLHPASPQTERIALADDIVPISNEISGVGRSIQIRKGQVIHIPFTTMHTNPEVWGPSAAVFDPTRWLVAQDPSKLPHGWSGLLTFCDGPRNCVGWRLAVLEFKIILATLIRSLVFHDTHAVVQEKISPTLQPVVDGKGGVLPLFITLV